MIQEIITYTIITIAVFIAVRKIIKNFAVKNGKPVKMNHNNDTSNVAHKCADCVAECM